LPKRLNLLFASSLSAARCRQHVVRKTFYVRSFTQKEKNNFQDRGGGKQIPEKNREGRKGGGFAVLCVHSRSAEND
jgi:hypothetical protein